MHPDTRKVTRKRTYKGPEPAGMKQNSTPKPAGHIVKVSVLTNADVNGVPACRSHSQPG